MSAYEKIKESWKKAKKFSDLEVGLIYGFLSSEEEQLLEELTASDESIKELVRVIERIEGILEKTIIDEDPKQVLGALIYIVNKIMHIYAESELSKSYLSNVGEKGGRK